MQLILFVFHKSKAESFDSALIEGGMPDIAVRLSYENVKLYTIF